MTPQQIQIRDAALALSELLTEVVPSSTVHWVVENTRDALSRLASFADTVKTFDARDERRVSGE